MHSQFSEEHFIDRFEADEAEDEPVLRPDLHPLDEPHLPHPHPLPRPRSHELHDLQTDQRLRGMSQIDFKTEIMFVFVNLSQLDFLSQICTYS